MRKTGAWLVSGMVQLALTGAARAESISGVCPDGSIYIVQHERQIPCSRSKQVEPGEVPPVRPDYLPKPHTWEVWAEQNDPNNPYNVVDQARQVRALGAAGGAAGASGAAPGGGAGLPAPTAGANAPQAAPSAPAARELGPLELGLGERDLADLFAIVELAQQRTPARFERQTAGGDGVARVAFARSRAFERHLVAAQEARGVALDGPVLLFAARSDRPQEFWPNFVFVQESLTFQPDAASDRQLGVLQGHLGELKQGEVVLGYVVLPRAMSLDGRALDIYWDDRRTTATF